MLDAFPPEVVGYWHDFGHSQRKEFLGWHDHVETLRAARAAAFRRAISTIAAARRRTTCRSATAKSHFTALLPLMPENAIGVLELAPGTPEEQVIASRHLWNSYVAASG